MTSRAAALLAAHTAPETPAMQAQRRRFMTLAILGAALLGAVAGVLNSKGVF
ncbi:MAG: hypothetical protein ABI395_02930 [Sphingobium sp.]